MGFYLSHSNTPALGHCSERLNVSKTYMHRMQFTQMNNCILSGHIATVRAWSHGSELLVSRTSTFITFT